jgi:hypothetical protein
LLISRPSVSNKLEEKTKRSTAYLMVPDSIESYYGWLASQRLAALAGPSRAEIVSKREERVNSAIDSVAELYPAPYRQAILSASPKLENSIRVLFLR